ncbi:protein BONZAI 3-like [Beta vulgaris subsp. vulgaris]|uniref:protein BONZAI 3-like n=1 Tax=Beta vulgaris subsp. vulgaris TaxID=3555 RepID=UPI0020375D6C|nr:protein BONZAI 3-like [Beta vulgaris subsp. vulgaris]
MEKVYSSAVLALTAKIAFGSDYDKFINKNMSVSVFVKFNDQKETKIYWTRVALKEEIQGNSKLIYWSAQEINVNYRFGAKQLMIFSVNDEDSQSGRQLREYEIDLHKIITTGMKAKVRYTDAPDIEDNDWLYVSINMSESHIKKVYSLDLELNDCPKDAQYLQISQDQDVAGNRVVVCKTIENNKCHISLMQHIGFQGKQILIEGFDEKKTKFGTCEPSISDLKQMCERGSIKFSITPISGEEGKGQLIVKEFKEKEGIFDYVSQGFVFRLMFAIDFTDSNRLTDSSNLHYITKSESEANATNKYIQVFKGFYDVIIGCESSLKPFYAWGFGGERTTQEGSSLLLPKVKSDDDKSKGKQFQFKGLEDLITSYTTAGGDVTLRDSTDPEILDEVINKAIDVIKMGTNDVKDRNYYLLLIVIAGDLKFIEKLLKKKAEYSLLPLSILFVGANCEGDTEYKKLEEFCSKQNNPLECGDINTRDIASFTKISSPSYVEKILDTVSSQFLSYVHNKGIKAHKHQSSSQ